MATSDLGKWESLRNGKLYHIDDLGRPGVFLLPAQKLKMRIGDMTVEEDLHEFLVKAFGAYTSSTVPNFGFWKAESEKRVFYDICVEYEVAFAGKEKIPLLLAKLASIAQAIGEECIYVKAGQYACLVSQPKQ